MLRPTSDFLRAEAKKLEAQAARLRRQADRIDAIAVNPSPAPVLRGYALKAADYISQNPRRTGEEIAAAIGCSFDYFRKLSDRLKANGFACRTYGGGGWYRNEVTRLQCDRTDFQSTTPKNNASK